MVKKSARPPARNEEPEEINLPLGKWRIGQYWGWNASAILPGDEDGNITESIIYFRKRFRRGYIHLVDGKRVNTQSGAFRDHNVPYIVQHPSTMVAYCLGNSKRIRSLLKRNVKHLGSKRRRGLGRVNSISVEIIAEDLSLVRDGLAMRWLPDQNGLRQVRLRPPYWNTVNRVPVCEIGAPFDVNRFDYR